MTEASSLRSIWPEWEISGGEIGAGDGSKVYIIKKIGYQVKNPVISALKVISIPFSRSSPHTNNRESCQSLAENIVNDYMTTRRLNGHRNIVDYQDFAIVPHNNDYGCDILIRMERLTPLTEYIAQNGLSRRQLIKMGIDLCNALEMCSKNNLVHGNIKPENIYISDNGDYKLGDFGLTTNMYRDNNSLSKLATFSYMSPEIYGNYHAGSCSDIYSLGLIMYRLLNDGNLPFSTKNAQSRLSDYSAYHESMSHRMNGEYIPWPSHGQNNLGQVILKAAAYRPEDRYLSAEEFRAALIQLMNVSGDEQILSPSGETFQTPPHAYVPMNVDRGSKPEINWKKYSLIIGIPSVLLLIGILSFVFAVPKLSGLYKERKGSSEISADSNNMYYISYMGEKGSPFYAEPNDQSETIETLSYPDELCIEKTENGFAYAKFQDKYGWIEQKYLRRLSDKGTVEQPSDESWIEGEHYLVTTDHDNGVVTHTTPSSYSEITDRIPDQTEVFVEAIKDDFAYTQYNGQYFWINMKFLKKEKVSSYHTNGDNGSDGDIIYYYD